ncbi:MAG TPA: biotin-dependent carboxyltransferase family protein, partial [Chryseosolibacter sp.]|nr:biotin-dependent carboxyltransferase family protein [Chryseosolibacter sp.]
TRHAAMGLKVIKAGVLNTIQDRGRTGFSKWGINPGGLMDAYAGRVANTLVGNPMETGVVELHFPAGELLATRPLVMALGGADFGAVINDIAIPVWRTVLIPSGAVLRFTRKIRGERCYLAVQGGFAADVWLNSCSTNLKLGAGGIGGRPLRKDDVLEISPTALPLKNPSRPVIFRWSVNSNSVYENPNEIRVVQGPEWDWIDPEAQLNFIRNSFVIDRSSDRMGYYLAHTPLTPTTTQQLVSSAVTMGTIQLMPSGRMLVLMADHQTTGGYPRIAHVITTDLPKLAQLGAGEAIRLKKIPVDEAEKIVISLGRHLRIIQQSCLQNLRNDHALR